MRDKITHKGYLIEPNQFSHYTIRTDGKGSVIKELRGSYTSVLKAIQAIDLATAYRNKKRDKNGTSDDTSGVSDV